MQKSKEYVYFCITSYVKQNPNSPFYMIAETAGDALNFGTNPKKDHKSVTNAFLYGYAETRRQKDQADQAGNQELRQELQNKIYDQQYLYLRAGGRFDKKVEDKMEGEVEAYRFENEKEKQRFAGAVSQIHRNKIGEAYKEAITAKATVIYRHACYRFYTNQSPKALLTIRDGLENSQVIDYIKKNPNSPTAQLRKKMEEAGIPFEA